MIWGFSALTTGRPRRAGKGGTDPLVLTYVGLLVSAITSATLLPGSSEGVLLALLATGQGDPLLLVAVATAGNVIGSLATWAVGQYFAHLRNRPWFPIDLAAYERAQGWVPRFGVWSLLLSWVPVIGDPITLAAGLLRVPLLPFLILVTMGKAGRYLALLGAVTWWRG